jgi:dTDP-glucose 4,6-dehydratase
MLKLLVTGGAGFIGSNFIHYILGKHLDWEVTNLDKLTYAGNLENLKDIDNNPRYRFIKGDVADKECVNESLRYGFHIVVNFAAESHVDRSILDALPFIDTNVKGTQVLLEGVRQYGIEKFIQISTDEVYGSTEKNKFTEESPLLPNSPYAASKAASDLLCRTYWKTHNLPVIVTRCSNNYGPFQFPEKFIPLIITNALENEEIPVYGDGLNIRDWIHVEDHCRALDLIVQQGQPGEIYNIGANNEKTNLELVNSILNSMEKPPSLIKFVTDRPGHDRHYAMNITKIKNSIGWKPLVIFRKGLRETVHWYIENKPWWQRIKSGKHFNEYYKGMYSGR